MLNFEKPLNQFTEEELQQKINQWDPKFGALALYELQRREQEKNGKQISDLIKVISDLKDITKINQEISEKSGKNNNKLAKLAIIIALIGIVVQVVLSVKKYDKCADFGGGDIRCTTWIDAGIFSKTTKERPI